MSISKIKNSIKILGLIFIIFVCFFISNKASAVSVVETQTSISPTLITFNGKVVYSPGEQELVLYYYFFKYSETSTAVVDATRVKLTTTPPLHNFLLFLGSTSKPLTPNTKYVLAITDATTLGAASAQYINRWFFDTPAAGTGNVISETTPPQVKTQPARSENASIVLVGSVQNGNNPSTVWFKIGTKENDLNKTTNKENKNKDGEFTALFSSSYRDPNAPANSLYYYQACAKNTKGEICSSKIESFGSGMANQTIPLTPGQTNSIKTDTTYTPLAPLPGLEGTFDTKTDCAFGKYLNILIKLFIGIVAVLSMIMIVMGGIEYMTSELVSSKEAGKSRIKNAVLGLLLALGSYAILNTLNPKLLEVCLGNLPEAKVVIDSEDETEPWTTYSSGNVSPSLCKEGLRDVEVVWKTGNPKPKKIRVCGSIAENLKKLLTDANNINLNLSGGGFRTYQEQVNARIRNKCPDIYNSPPKDCKTPTARPGTSMHERGLAVDFTCNGVIVKQGDPCFNWLETNAPKAGLKRLKSETWHWSTNGL